MKKATKYLIVILRRKSDGDAILKWIEKNTSFKWLSGYKPTSWIAHPQGRTLNFDLRSNVITFASEDHVSMTPTGIKENHRTASSWLRVEKLDIDEDVVYINTKPSVTKAIEEIKKYI